MNYPQLVATVRCLSAEVQNIINNGGGGGEGITIEGFNLTRNGDENLRFQMDYLRGRNEAGDEYFRIRPSGADGEEGDTDWGISPDLAYGHINGSGDWEINYDYVLARRDDGSLIRIDRDEIRFSNPSSSGEQALEFPPFSGVLVTEDGPQVLTGKTLTGNYVQYFTNSTGDTAVSFFAPSGSVNYPRLYGNTTGNDAILEAAGADTNVNLRLRGQGTGLVVVERAEISNATRFGLDGAAYVQLTTSRAATNNDNGKVLYSTSGSAITLTVPDSVTKPFSCTLKQEGTGKISVAVSGTAVLRNIDSHTGTAGQWASAAIDYRTGNDVVLLGRTS